MALDQTVLDEVAVLVPTKNVDKYNRNTVNLAFYIALFAHSLIALGAIHTRMELSKHNATHDCTYPSTLVALGATPPCTTPTQNNVREARTHTSSLYGVNTINGIAAKAIPSGMSTPSDNCISADSAKHEISHLASTRDLSVVDREQLIASHTKTSPLGMFGTPCVDMRGLSAELHPHAPTDPARTPSTAHSGRPTAY